MNAVLDAFNSGAQSLTTAEIKRIAGYTCNNHARHLARSLSQRFYPRLQIVEGKKKTHTMKLVRDNSPGRFQRVTD